MKKLIILICAVLVALLVIYKLDIKPEVKEVRKEITNDKLPTN